MKLTSAKANKLLKQMNEEYEALLEEEKNTSTFLAAMGEDPSALKPDYSYELTKNRIIKLETEICRLKHAINIFNTTHKPEGFDMTVDEALIYIAMLSKKTAKLAEMKNRLPKAREISDIYSVNGIIDYRYINYDRQAVKTDYELAYEELSRLQIALDVLNNTLEFEF